MKTLIFSLVTIVSLTYALQANACLPGVVVLNTVDSLMADGIHTRGALVVSIEDLEKRVISRGKAEYQFNDSEKGNEATHIVEYLGSVSDEGGVIQSSYMVRDLKTRESKTIKIKSNYRGGGMVAREVPRQGEPTIDSQLLKSIKFSNYEEVGCR